MKKKIIIIGLIGSLILGSNVTAVVTAGQVCSNHNASKKQFIRTEIVKRTHQYVDGYIDGEIALIKTCTYQIPITYLDLVCSNCGGDSGQDEVVEGAGFNHSACGK